MRRLQHGPLPRRGFLALGGAAAWCAACAGGGGTTGSTANVPGSCEPFETSARNYPKEQQYSYDGRRWRGAWESTPQAWPIPQIDVFYYTAGANQLPGRLREAGAAGPGPLVSYQPVKLADFEQSEHPRHVQMIARAAEFALWRFRELGFKAPALGANGATTGTLKIYLVQTRDYRGMTSPDWDFIELSNQIREETALLTVGHEIFHRIQYAYNPTRREQRTCGPGEIDLWTLVLEGGGRYSEDLLVDGTNRYEYDGERWFTARRRPLFRSASFDGALDGAVYEAALFWKYVGEQHAGPWTGANQASSPTSPPRGWMPEPEVRREAETQRKLLEAITKPPPDYKGEIVPGRIPITVGSLREARKAMYGIGTFDQPVAVGDAQASSATQQRSFPNPFRLSPPPVPGNAALSGETTWGNFIVALALNGQSEGDLRFRFQETPAFRGVAGGRMEVPANATVAYEALPEIGPGAVPTAGGGGGRSGRNDDP